MRAFAISVAILLCAAPAFAAPRSHAAAARKAERRGDWRKALREWKAAYAKEGNAEYLIAIGDAYSQLGNKAEARKSYEAYLADPLAVPSRVEKVKTRIAQIEARNDSLALPALPLPDVSPVPAARTRIHPGQLRARRADGQCPHCRRNAAFAGGRASLQNAEPGRVRGRSDR